MVSESSTLSLAGDIIKGKEITVIIKNISETSDIKISIPTNSQYICINGYEILIKKDCIKIVHINIVNENNIYIETSGGVSDDIGISYL